MSEQDATLDELAKSDPSESADSHRLGDQIEIIKGTKPGEIVEGPIGNAEKYLVVDTLTGEEQKYAIDDGAPRARSEDSIMIMDGSKSGRVYPGDHGILGSTMASIRPNGINPTFLYFFLENNFNRINSATKGSAVPHTDKDIVRSFEYRITSRDEQRKIASVLYTVDQAIQKTEAVIQQLKRVSKSLRQELFTKGYYEHETKFHGAVGEIPKDWETTRLHQVADVARGKFTHRPRNDPDFYGGDYPFIQTGEVVDAVGELETYSQSLNEKGKEVSKSFEAGTVLVSITGRNTGSTAIATFEIYFPDSLVGITPSDELDAYFLEQYLRYRHNYLIRLSTKTTQKNLNLSLLRPVEVVKPPLNEQEDIAEVLSNNDDQIKMNTGYLSRLKRLKQGLMQDLLSGDVRTHDTDIEIVDEVLQHG